MIKIHQYERIWIIISGVVVALMFVGLLAAGLYLGVKMPSNMGMVDPRSLQNETPFDKPGITQTAPGKYLVVIVAKTWYFTPNKISVPVGSEVTFKITSADVTHGFMIENTDVNVMIVPGQVTEFTYKASKSGKFTFLCHEYCGAGHKTMTGELTVTQ